jgi:hypothetical protein
MAKLQYHIRRAVRRPGAETYLLITLLSFAASVSGTRFFLEITGYPQLGGKDLHIAHVLWGGLLLFIGSILPLLLANRWVYPLTALLSGIGVGLFIDEVGKFITQNNDYFYPPAAPIIYAFFMLTVLLYTRIRRQPAQDARHELYEVLEGLEEILDNDLDAQEKEDLIKKLQQIDQRYDDQDLKKFTLAILRYLQDGQIQLIPKNATHFDKINQALRAFEDRYLRRGTLRAALAGGLFALGIYSLLQLIPLLAIGVTTNPIQNKILKFVQTGVLTGPGLLDWFSTWLVLDGLCGILLIISAAFLAVGQEQRGINLGYLSLLLSLIVVNLFYFYFDQFSSIVNASIQLVLLWGIMVFRKKFLRSTS